LPERARRLRANPRFASGFNSPRPRPFDQDPRTLEGTGCLTCDRELQGSFGSPSHVSLFPCCRWLRPRLAWPRKLPPAPSRTWPVSKASSRICSYASPDVVRAILCRCPLSHRAGTDIPGAVAPVCRSLQTVERRHHLREPAFGPIHRHKKSPGRCRGFESRERLSRSVLRDHRRVEVIVQPGAEDVFLNAGRGDRLEGNSLDGRNRESA
jgi:hypothetical protein